MHDAQALKEQVRQSVDLVELIERHVALKRAGSTLKGLCPFHQEKTPSFTVYPAKQFFKCYGCGVGGDIFTFVQRWERVEFREALEWLAEQAGIPLPRQGEQAQTGPTRTQLAKVTRWAASSFRQGLLDESSGRTARAYLAERRIEEAIAERFELGYAPDRFDWLEPAAREASISREQLLACGLIKTGQRGGTYDAFRHRLMFPIVDTMDRVIGFGGRALGDDPAKYLNSAESLLFDKGRSLYGLNLARETISRQGRVVVVEGYTDCLMAHQFGFTETVATMGTAMTEAHVGLLKRYADRAILLFDSDAAGQKAAERALAVTLTQQLDVRIASVPEGKDPCDFLLACGAEAFEAVLTDSLDAAEYMWRQLIRRHGTAQTGRQRREAVEAFLDLVATGTASGSMDTIGRGFLVNQVAKVLSLPAEEVHRELSRRSRQRVARSSRMSRAPADDEPSPAGPRRVPGADQTARPDPAQRALRELLEVLVNDPSHYATVSSWLRPEAFADPQLAAVGDAVLDLIETTGSCEIAALLGRFTDPSDAECVLDLHTQGQQKGNYAAQVEGAIRYLERSQQRDEARQAAKQASDVDEQLRVVGQSRRRSAGFLGSGPLVHAMRNEDSRDRDSAE